MAEGFLAAKIDRLGVYFHHPIPVGLVDIKWERCDLNPGIIDKHIELPKG